MRCAGIPAVVLFAPCGLAVVVLVFVGGVCCVAVFSSSRCLFLRLGPARCCRLCSFRSLWLASLGLPRSFSSCRRSSSVAVPACSAGVASPSASRLRRVASLLGSLVGFAFVFGASACRLLPLVCSFPLSLFACLLRLVLRVRLLRGAFLCVKGRGLACANGTRGLRRGGSHATASGRRPQGLRLWAVLMHFSTEKTLRYACLHFARPTLRP